MLTLSTTAHLASVRERLKTTKLSERDYNDLACVALHYFTYAKEDEQRLEAAKLYDQVVRQEALTRHMVRDEVAL